MKPKVMEIKPGGQGLAANMARKVGRQQGKTEANANKWAVITDPDHRTTMRSFVRRKGVK